MAEALLSVVETPHYLSKAESLLSEEERFELINMIASDPNCGDLIVGGGGVRKVRFGFGGKGKSGGARALYFFHSRAYPVFLLTVFAKAARVNLNRAEANALGVAAKRLIATYEGGR